MKKPVLMTEGKIWKQILLFAIPLLLGNLFQQLYTIVDSIVVGNIIGKEALAAVGSAGPAIGLLISIFIGIAAGSSVVISQYYGAYQRDELQKAIHTTVSFAIIIGMVLSIVGIVACPYMLKMMDTPESIMADSVLYFRISFIGALPSMLYSIGCGIFRAIGDSARPLIFLIVSTISNTLLDLLFVGVFHFGIAGVAAAAVAADALSAFLVLRALCREKTDYRLDFKKLRISGKHLRQIIGIGIPGGIQGAIVSLSGVIIQSSINAFGDAAVAGCVAYNKIDGFALMPSGSFSIAVTTFIGQNVGAKKFDRVKKGARFGILTAMFLSQALGILIYIFAPNMIRMFNQDPDVIYYGTLMARNISFAYFLLTLSQSMAGILRGAGLALAPMLITGISWSLMRVAWVKLLVPVTYDIRVIFWAYPVTWLITAFIFTVYFFKSDWMRRSGLKESYTEN